MRRSLSFQRQCVEHFIALSRDADDTVTEGAKQACLTLAWFEKRQELVRELIRLETAAPELAELLRQFPGAQLSAIREAAE